MTVPSEINKSGPYHGNGVTTVFAYGFKIVDAAHLRVVMTDPDGQSSDLVLNSDYTVTGIGNDSGGNVVKSTPLLAGYDLTIVRDVPFVQDTDLENQGAYYAETVEDALDLAAMRDQQLREAVDRAVKVPENVDPSNLDQLVADITYLADVYLGAKPSDPTVRNDGSPLKAGDMYFNTTLKEMRLYDGGQWIGVTARSLGTYPKSFVGDGSETEFFLDLDPAIASNVFVWVGGVRQVPDVDYTVSGSTVTLTTAPGSGVAVDTLVLFQVGRLPKTMDGIFDSRADVEITFIDGAINTILTGGYYAGGDGGGALYKRVATEPTHAGKIQSADGAWWELSSDIISPKMFGAKLDGLSNDTQAFSDLDEFVNLVTPGLINIDGNTSSSTVGPWASHNQHTPPQMNRPLRVGAKVGSPASPDPNAGGNPMLWFEKWTSKNQHDPYAHNTEGGHIEINYVGSGEAGNQVQGTPMGFVSSVTTHGRNVGTETAPEYDMRGSPIGLCGFAEAKKSPGPGNIVTAMWAYATTPTMTQAEFDACTDVFYTVGLEVNIMQNMPAEPAFGAKKTVGVLLMNYRWAPDVKDWTNGLLLDGSGIQGDGTSNDVRNWNGFRVGIQMDKIKEYGIRFGYLMEGVGISFPDDYTSMSRRPHISLDTGDTGILMSEYKGGDTRPNLLWQNNGRLYFRQTDGWGAEIMMARTPVIDPTSVTVTKKVRVMLDGVTYYLHASTTE